MPSRTATLFIGVAIALSSSGCAFDLPELASPEVAADSGCKALRDGGNTTSQPYSVRPDGSDQAVRVYCEMGIDGGGWTLVARSAGEAELEGFGWGSATGSIDDDAASYSLHVGTSGLAFSEILVVAHGTGKEPAKGAYKVPLPSNFLTSCADVSCETEGTSMVWGNDCDPSVVPRMFANAGYTSDEQYYFLRDKPEKLNFGLAKPGYNLAGADCETSGELHGLPGMIFVR